MSNKEIKLCEILKMVNEKQTTLRKGALRIGMTERNFKRLLHDYRENGPERIISDHRGLVSNNRTSKEEE